MKRILLVLVILSLSGCAGFNDRETARALADRGISMQQFCAGMDNPERCMKDPTVYYPIAFPQWYP